MAVSLPNNDTWTSQSRRNATHHLSDLTVTQHKAPRTDTCPVKALGEWLMRKQMNEVCTNTTILEGWGFFSWKKYLSHDFKKFLLSFSKDMMIFIISVTNFSIFYSQVLLTWPVPCKDLVRSFDICYINVWADVHIGIGYFHIHVSVDCILPGEGPFTPSRSLCLSVYCTHECINKTTTGEPGGTEPSP